MHELAITEGVVSAVAERIRDAKVTRVRLEIGVLSGVVADSVRFCFDLVTLGTNLEGASLEILEPSASCQCRACGAEFAPDWPIPFCAWAAPMSLFSPGRTCESCRSMRLEKCATCGLAGRPNAGQPRAPGCCGCPR